MENFWVITRLFVNCFCTLALFFVMCDFRLPRRKALLIFIGLAAACTLVSAVINQILGREIMMRWFAIMMAVPGIILMLLLTKDRFSMLFFDFFTAVNLLYLAAIAGLSVSGGRIWLDALIRLVIYLTCIILFQRYFYRAFHFLSLNMKRGWGVICVIPFLFFALVMFMGLYPTVRTDNFPFVIFLYVIMAFVYVVIYQIFRGTYIQLTQEEDLRIMAAQLHMERRQLAMQEDHLERMRVLRHDFRHYLRGLSSMLEEGKAQEARETLGRIAAEFGERTPECYCDDPVINAELSYYISRARKEGVEVVLNKISLPNPLPVDSLELSMVFGNALENACLACARLPERAKKRIEITCLSSPQFVFEIANTYDGAQVHMDSQGFPMSDREGHGIGTRSIAAFVKKYNAVCDYDISGNTFRLRILIPRASV